MGRNDDVGFPRTINAEGDRKKLIEEIDRDQREEAVNELFDEAQDIFWQAGGSSFDLQETDAIKAVMRLCWERWAQA